MTIFCSKCNDYNLSMFLLVYAYNEFTGKKIVGFLKKMNCIEAYNTNEDHYKFQFGSGLCKLGFLHLHCSLAIARHQMNDHLLYNIN